MLRRISTLTLHLLGLLRHVLRVGTKAKRRGYIDIRR
jgi:hypothetical protein